MMTECISKNQLYQPEGGWMFYGHQWWPLHWGRWHQDRMTMRSSAEVSFLIQSATDSEINTTPDGIWKKRAMVLADGSKPVHASAPVPVCIGFLVGKGPFILLGVGGGGLIMWLCLTASVGEWPLVCCRCWSLLAVGDGPSISWTCKQQQWGQ